MKARFWLLVLLTTFSASASAVTYRCGNGAQSYYSDRPCTTTLPQPQQGRIGTYGPTEQQQSQQQQQTYTPKVAKPPEYAKYLNNSCAQMEEATRTAPARGVVGDTLRNLHEDYRNRCAYDIRLAQERVSQDNANLERGRIEQRQQAAAQQSEQRRQDDQCANMRGVIADKRAAISSLDQRQRELLQTMQDNYNNRCLNRH